MKALLIRRNKEIKLEFDNKIANVPENLMPNFRLDAKIIHTHSRFYHCNNIRLGKKVDESDSFRATT